MHDRHWVLWGVTHCTFDCSRMPALKGTTELPVCSCSFVSSLWHLDERKCAKLMFRSLTRFKWYRSKSNDSDSVVFAGFVWSQFLSNFKNNLIPKTIGNRKRDCAWGCAQEINTTWENLQIEKHKPVRWAERTPSWFVLFDLHSFSGSVYLPSATSRTISFFYFISNSFWH